MKAAHEIATAQPAFCRKPALKAWFLFALAVALSCASYVHADELKFDDSWMDSVTNVSRIITTNQINALSNSPASNSLAATNSSGTNGMDALDNKYRLAMGDHLSFRIVQDEDDPKPLVVTDSGELELPYLGRFPAVGKTCKELAGQIKTELEKDYYYQATVIIAVDTMTKSRGIVYLVGPVRSPGPQEIPSDETLTLSKAILRAGGFNDDADQKKVKVTRKSESSVGTNETFVVNVNDILQKGKTEKDLVLQPGDFIYIAERSIRF